MVFPVMAAWAVRADDFCVTAIIPHMAAQPPQGWKKKNRRRTVCGVGVLNFGHASVCGIETIFQTCKLRLSPTVFVRVKANCVIFT